MREMERLGLEDKNEKAGKTNIGKEAEPIKLEEAPPILDKWKHLYSGRERRRKQLRCNGKCCLVFTGFQECNRKCSKFLNHDTPCACTHHDVYLGAIECDIMGIADELKGQELYETNESLCDGRPIDLDIDEGIIRPLGQG